LPIIETSADTVKDRQIGAVSLEDLTAIWILDPESGKRTNKLSDIEALKKAQPEDATISAEELQQKLNSNPDLLDISASF